MYDMTIHNLCMQEMMKPHVEYIHDNWQANNITLDISEFRVHATTKMNYNSCMQTRNNCMQQ